MADQNTVIADDIAAITDAETVMDSAIAFANAVPGWIQAAVAAALKNGATAAELQPLTDLIATVKSKKQALADAVVANTPAA